MSPHEIFIDVCCALVNDPAWESIQYPAPIHMALSLLKRAEMHLGIRTIEGYAPRESVTDTLYAAFNPADPDTWPCNDCGQPTLKGDELCGSCYEKEARERDNAEGDSFRTLGLCEADFQ